MKRNKQSLNLAKIISRLDVLKKQFEDMAKTYPQLNHILLQQSEDGIDPIVPDMLTHSCRLWDEKIGRWPRYDNERGYPTKHWLLFVGSLSQSGLSESQRMAANYDMLGRFCKLAEEAGKTVNLMDSNILPISKTKLWVRDPEEYWLLLLHQLYPPQHDFWFKKNENLPDNVGLSMRQAKENEPYSAILNDVFLSSAIACGTLLEKLQNGGNAGDTNSKTGNEKVSSIHIEKFDNRGGSTTFGEKSPIDNSKVTNPSPKEKEPWYKRLKVWMSIIVLLIPLLSFFGINQYTDFFNRKLSSSPTTQPDTLPVIKSPIDPNVVDINKPISKLPRG